MPALSYLATITGKPERLIETVESSESATDDVATVDSSPQPNPHDDPRGGVRGRCSHWSTVDEPLPCSGVRRSCPPVQAHGGRSRGFSDARRSTGSDGHHSRRYGVLERRPAGRRPWEYHAARDRADRPADLRRPSEFGTDQSVYLRCSDGVAPAQVRRLTVLGLFSVPSLQADACSQGSDMTAVIVASQHRG